MVYKKITFLFFVIILSLYIVISFVFTKNRRQEKPIIKVGILHSFTGTLAGSEKPVANATLLAIKEINKAGGLLGKKIMPIIMDGASDEKIFAQRAEELIVKEKVDVIFGCWTSASRKMVKPIVERHYHLLFYPVQYEGFEKSPNIIYTGAAPNQQIIPGIVWCFQNIGRRFFLVGSDYIFPHAANKIISQMIQTKGGTVVGEEYIPLGGENVDAIIKKIVDTKPEIIISTINGHTNISFFKALRSAGITSEKVPTMSFSIAEPEIQIIGPENVVGDYAVWGYFQSISNTTNDTFIRKFKKEYGEDQDISDPLEAAYHGVYLWKKAVIQAQTSNPRRVRSHIPLQAFYAPQGMIYIDRDNNHTWRFIRLGKIKADGQFDILWNSAKAVKPQPFTQYVTENEWEEFSSNLYAKWGKKWEETLS
jgi:urea transport system substrate-binding protein